MENAASSLMRFVPYAAAALAKWVIGWLWFRPTNLVDTIAFIAIMTAILALFLGMKQIHKLYIHRRPAPHRCFRTALPFPDECG